MRFLPTFVYAVVLVCSLDTQAHAQTAQQPPNDTDLKAAYCIGSIQQTLANAGPNLAESMNKTWQDRLQHLRAYLVPRVQYIDAVGLAAASARGQADTKAIGDSEFWACATPCATPKVPPPKGGADAAMQKCMLACDTEHRLPRIWACNDLSWLPF